MAGYSTMAKLDGGRVRTRAWAPTGAVMEAPCTGEATPAAGPVRVATVRDATVRDATVRDGRPLRIRAAERWTWLCDELAMTTFYLLDPESWR